jgi:hypothetical protein
MWRRLLPALLLVMLGAAPARAISTPALLDSLQRTSFEFFWNETNSANGLIRDRNASWSPASIASQGFGFSAICIGAQHGWVSRAAARDRVLTALKTYFNGAQGTATAGVIGYKGLFYHFLDMNSGTRTWDCELSTIDTALLMAGILDAREFFDSSTDTLEAKIRFYADSLYKRVDWNWSRNGSSGIRMGWMPGTGSCVGFCPYGEWIGYNEAMILYILALGSPTHAPTNGIGAWNRWTSGYQWSTWYGKSFVQFPPLFGHQYSHCWVDFRYIQDSYMRGVGITYFENSRRATYAQRSYCIANPSHWTGYSDLSWGLTAGDGPTGYNARGAPPPLNDDGTITPTATISSIPFAPEIVIPSIHYFYDNLSPGLWGPYGFNDGFNLSALWWDQEVIGIDQGPIIVMIENYRTGRTWERFMKNAWVRQGLLNAGFVTNPLAADDPPEESTLALSVTPNPFGGSARAWFTLPSTGRARLEAFDVQGRSVAVLADGVYEAGVHEAEWSDARLGAGVYFLKLRHGAQTVVRRCVRVQ